MSEDMYARTRRVVLKVEDTPHRAELVEYDPAIPIPQTVTACNNADSAVPPHCVARIVGAYAQGDGVTQVIAIDKPSSDYARDYLITGHDPIYTPAERDKDSRKSCYGQCHTHGVCLARYGGDKPEVGDVLGPSYGKWTLSKTGFPAIVTVLGVPNATEKLARVRFISGSDAIVFGELDGALSVGGNATMSVWAFDSTAHIFFDTGEDVEVYDWLMKAGASDIASGKKVIAKRYGDVAVLTEAECP